MLPKKKKPTVTVVENKEKGNKKKTRRVVRNTAQDTIPYLEQYENGLYLIDREKGLGRYAFIWHLGNTDYRLLKDTEKQKRLDAYSAVFNTLPPGPTRIPSGSASTSSPVTSCFPCSLWL